MKEIKIGDQVWMAENLDIDDGGEGIFHRDGQTYYTWEAAMRVTKNLEGWHLPTKAEFETLIKNCGGKVSAGAALKSAAGWKRDSNGTDAFGFSALPAGYRSSGGSFNNQGYYAYFWSSSEYSSDYAYSMYLSCSYGTAYLNYDYKDNGFSVRCLRDEGRLQAMLELAKNFKEV